MMSDLDMSHEKMSDFVLFALFVFVLVIKLRNLYFESYWNTLMFLDKKKCVGFDYFLSNSLWFGLIFIVWVEFRQ